MDFFGDYSIEGASCHPSSLSNYEDNVFASSDPFTSQPLLSPRDTRTSYPVEFANMSNLARVFGLQSLDTSASIPSNNDNYSLSTQQQYNPPESPTSRRSPPSSPRAVPCWRRRAQRQRDMHLQADPSHLRSIRDLVERMVSEGDQCATTPRTRPTLSIGTPAVPLAEGEEEDSEASDLSSLRSYSDSSNNSLDAGYSASPPSPQYQTSSVSRTGRIQKSRPRRNVGRDRR